MNGDVMNEMKLRKVLPLLLGAAAMSVSLLAPARAKCTDELNPDGRGRAGAQRPAAKDLVPRSEPAEASLDPKLQLQLIAREAAKRSAEVGAARLLAEASAYDVKETRGARYPTVTVSGTAGPGASYLDDNKVARGMQGSVSLNVNGPLVDWGKINRLTEYRSGLADAAKFSADGLREQVVLEAVNTAVERNRYRVTAQVYQQYVRKMSCLVEALEMIVAEDKGRASELVQARKTQAQAELSRDAATAQGRQIELKLKKLIGEQAGLGDGITIPLSQVPEIGEINRQIETSNDVQQLRAQAEAMESYSRAVLAGQKPQVGWTLSKTEGIRGDNRTSAWQAGVSVSYTLFNGYSDQAAAMASSKRAEAARQQLAEIMADRTSRTAQIYDAAVTSFDRARRFVEVLRESDRVRAFTFQQWSQLGRRSLFDVMSAESDHFNLRVAYVNALHDGLEASAHLRSLGSGLTVWLAVPER